MKDAYSFHLSQEDLEKHYWRYHKAYERIYSRAGLDVVSVASDAGMMGGDISHEFMYLTPIGEDTIALCDSCDYRANVEAAQNIVENPPQQEIPLEKVHTPNFTTIDEISDFLKVTAKDTCKAVVYQKNSDNGYVLAFMRGDMDVNETKLANLLGEEIHPIALDETSDLVAGFMGPVNLQTKATIYYDASLKGTNNLICGANETDYHYKGFSIDRDVKDPVFVDVTKIQQESLCPTCGQKTIRISRGIEVGNIFQLGDKYTKSMDMTFIDEEGVTHYPIMGCYGIGVGRLAASVLEEHHDENGPIWPVSIAPWQVQICCLRADEPGVKETADKLYEDLQNQGVEVLYDDRAVSAGVMFSDADLFGLPLRLVVSPRNLKTQQVEVSSRDKTLKEMVNLDEAVSYTKTKLAEMK